MGISEELQPQVLTHGYSFERILLPLDGSASAERALSTVQSLCKSHGARVILVRMIEPRSLDSHTPSAEESLQIARVYLSQVAAALGKQGIEAKPVARIWTVPDGLLAVAAEEGASLIVMSTHGRLTSEALPFGKVAEELFRSSAIPILAVPSHARAGNGRVLSPPGEPIRTVLLPTDGSEDFDGVFPVAAAFAISFGADLAILLQVVPSAPTGRGEAEEHVGAEEHLGRLARPFERKRIPTLRLVQAGDPVRAIAEVARERKADIVAMSVLGGAPRKDAAVGDVTEGVLQALDIPVFMARPVASGAVSNPDSWFNPP